MQVLMLSLLTAVSLRKRGAHGCVAHFVGTLGSLRAGTGVRWHGGTEGGDNGLDSGDRGHGEVGEAAGDFLPSEPGCLRGTECTRAGSEKMCPSIEGRVAHFLRAFW